MQNNKLFVVSTSNYTTYITDNDLIKEIGNPDVVTIEKLNNVQSDLDGIKDILFIYCRDKLNTGLVLNKPFREDINRAIQYCYANNFDNTDIVFVCNDAVIIKRFNRRAYDPDVILSRRLAIVLIVCICTILFKDYIGVQKHSLIMFVNVLRFILQYYIFRVGFRLFQLCMEELSSGT